MVKVAPNGPCTSVGRGIVTGRPCAASACTAASASIFESPYTRPVIAYGRSSTTSPSGRPYTSTVERCTTFFTPALSAPSISTRVPSTMVAGSSPVTAQCTTCVTPDSARATWSGLRMSHCASSTPKRATRAAVDQRRTPATTCQPPAQCSTSTRRAPMKPPAPVTKIRSAIGREPRFREEPLPRVVPRLVQQTAAAIALVDDGDGRPHVRRADERFASAADHVDEVVEQHGNEVFIALPRTARAHLAPLQLKARPFVRAAFDGAALADYAIRIAQLGEPAEMDVGHYVVQTQPHARDRLRAAARVVGVIEHLGLAAQPPAHEVHHVHPGIEQHAAAAAEIGRRGGRPVERRAELEADLAQLAERAVGDQPAHLARGGKEPPRVFANDGPAGLDPARHYRIHLGCAVSERLLAEHRHAMPRELERHRAMQ